MTDSDAFYKNAGAFTAFEKMTVGADVYFLRCMSHDGELFWIGPLRNQMHVEDGVSFVRYRRIKSLYSVRVLKTKGQRSPR